MTGELACESSEEFPYPSSAEKLLELPRKPRLPSATQFAERTPCGVWVLNIETGQTLGFCQFEEGVQEIFAVEALPGVRFPDLVNHDSELIGRSYVLGDEALAQVPEDLRK